MKFLRVAFVFSFAAMCGLTACVADDPTTGGGDDTSGNDASTDGSNSGDSTVGPGADGSTGDSAPGVDAGPKRYCQTILAPDGSADFFCADFDGTDLEEGFPDGSVSLTDGSTLALTQDVEFSAPNALASKTTGVDQDEAYLTWLKAGPTNLQTITVNAEINPDLYLATENAGALQLLTIQEQSAPQKHVYAFEYVTGANLPDASNDKGYVLFIKPGTLLAQNILLPDIPSGWTDVQITVDFVAGTVTVSYDGMLQLMQTLGSFTSTDTTARVTVGTINQGSNNAYGFRYDNFRVSTTRQ
jgi:hypothetical protein